MVSSCPRHKDDNQALIMSIALKLLLARDLNIGHYKLQLYLLVLRSEYNQQKVNAPHKKLIKKNIYLFLYIRTTDLTKQ